MLNVEKYYQDVELFVQTFDLSKSSFPFFGEFEMYNDYFRLKKKKGEEGEKEGSSYFLFLSKAIRKLS